MRLCTVPVNSVIYVVLEDRDLYVIKAAQIYATGFGLVGVIEMRLIYGAVRPATTPLDEAHGNERAAIAL